MSGRELTRLLTRLGMGEELSTRSAEHYFDTPLAECLQAFLRVVNADNVLTEEEAKEWKRMVSDGEVQDWESARKILDLAAAAAAEEEMDDDDSDEDLDEELRRVEEELQFEKEKGETLAREMERLEAQRGILLEKEEEEEECEEATELVPNQNLTQTLGQFDENLCYLHDHISPDWSMASADWDGFIRAENHVTRELTSLGKRLFPEEKKKLFLVSKSGNPSGANLTQEETERFFRRYLFSSFAKIESQRMYCYQRAAADTMIEASQNFMRVGSKENQTQVISIYSEEEDSILRSLEPLLKEAAYLFVSSMSSSHLDVRLARREYVIGSQERILWFLKRQRGRIQVANDLLRMDKATLDFFGEDIGKAQSVIQEFASSRSVIQRFLDDVIDASDAASSSRPISSWASLFHSSASVERRRNDMPALKLDPGAAAAGAALDAAAGDEHDLDYILRAFEAAEASANVRTQIWDDNAAAFVDRARRFADFVAQEFRRAQSPTAPTDDTYNDLFKRLNTAADTVLKVEKVVEECRAKKLSPLETFQENLPYYFYVKPEGLGRRVADISKEADTHLDSHRADLVSTRPRPPPPFLL